jgi:translation initiation factor IF-2
MAKVRVYELARELNMDSKQLVEKLLAGGMSIKNYMSTLDETSVTKAKGIIAGTVSEVVEEKRIKPTIIRRRRKTVKVKPPEPPAPAPEKEEVEKIEPPVAEKTAPGVSPPGEKKVKFPKGKEVKPPKGKEVKPPKRKVAKKEKEPTPVEAVEAPPEEKAPVPEKEVEEKRAKVKAKAKKAKRKEAPPAKIIKKAEEGPLKDVLEKGKRKPDKEVRKAKKAEPPVEPDLIPTEEKEERGGKRKKEKRRGEQGETRQRSSFRQRKVEVFERADLYDGRKVRRKKKDAAAGEEGRKLKQTEITVPKAIKRRIKVPEKVTVSELAKAMGTKAVELVKRLLVLGVPANINQTIDFDTAALVADEFGYELELDQFELDRVIEEVDDKPEDLEPRPPVVTIMGHVDHGKTSLLDYIRQSNVMEGESGGITQHIGAYYVEREGGDIVFLDTPGHEAFTAMRARGAKVTDIIVLVVAADDGVMPQTKEAINHARAAEIPIIVAINKIDKANAQPDKVKRELAELELVPEEWGGDTIFGAISAKTGEGVDDLMELIHLQSEILELKVNSKKAARGTIIEAKLDKTRGPVATVLIRSGTIKKGDYFICGDCSGRVRAMINNRGLTLTEAGPSVPVEIYGISGVPMAGDELIAVEDEKTARQVMVYRQEQTKAKEMAQRGVVSLDDLFERIKEGEVKELKIVLKADVQGSLEALSESLVKQSTNEVKLGVIHGSTGGITETDVMLASASGAIIIGFNVRANPRVVELAEKENVDIRYYDVIYNAIQDIRNAMAGLLEPVLKEDVIGRAEVKEVFRVPRVGAVAGCYVTDGHVERNAQARLLREEVVIYDGKLASLRRFKDDVKEVQTGYECGIALEGFQDIKKGDVFEIYQVREERAEL